MTDRDGLGTTLALRSPRDGRCKVCRLETHLRGQIDRLLINGTSITEIEHYVNDLHYQGIISLQRSVPSRQSISNHNAKHLPIKDIAVRRIMEKRALERDQDIENGVENLINEVSAAEIIMKKGLQNVIENREQVSVRDTLAAAKLVREFTRDEEGSLDIAQMFNQLSIIMQAVKETLSPQQYNLVLARIDELAGQEVIEGEVDDPLEIDYNSE